MRRRARHQQRPLGRQSRVRLSGLGTAGLMLRAGRDHYGVDDLDLYCVYAVKMKHESSPSSHRGPFS